MDDKERLKEIKKRDIAMLYGTKLEADWYWLEKQAEKVEKQQKEIERLKICNEDANKALHEMNVNYGKHTESVEVLEKEVKHFENLYNNLVVKYRELKTGR